MTRWHCTDPETADERTDNQKSRTQLILLPHDAQHLCQPKPQKRNKIKPIRRTTERPTPSTLTPKNDNVIRHSCTNSKNTNSNNVLPSTATKARRAAPTENYQSTITRTMPATGTSSTTTRTTPALVKMVLVVFNPPQARLVVHLIRLLMFWKINNSLAPCRPDRKAKRKDR